MTLQTLGQYELFEVIGRGGFGTVYRAWDTSQDVECALKVLHPELAIDKDFVARFRSEWRFAKDLNHPHILPVYSMQEEQGRYFLAMKYLPDGSLKQLLDRQKRLPFSQALEITRQVADALTFAFSQSRKIIHRDLKPGNILFEKLPDPAGNLSICLSDFSLAKALEYSGGESLTATGATLGTPAYMAPEVWRGQPASSATDQYSLACMFYEMVTGSVLFSGRNTPEIMSRHTLDGPKFPSIWPQDIPSGIEPVLKRALSVDPLQRYPNLMAFYEALEKSAVQTVRAAKTPDHSKFLGFGLIGLAALFFCLLVFIVAGLFIYNMPIAPVETPTIEVLVPTDTTLPTDIPQPTDTSTPTIMPQITDTPQATYTALPTYRPLPTYTPYPTVVPPTFTFTPTFTPTSSSTPVPPAKTGMVVAAIDFNVFSNQPWQDTQLDVNPGDTITISYVSGLWGWTGTRSNFTGTGDPNFDGTFREICTAKNDCPITNAALSSLVAKIGDNPALNVGNYIQYPVPADIGNNRRLFVMGNDSFVGLYDNVGSIQIHIIVTRP